MAQGKRRHHRYDRLTRANHPISVDCGRLAILAQLFGLCYSCQTNQSFATGEILAVNKNVDALEISGPLAESMDQSIGEATSVMGAMITELMRRSLRGGVLKIGEGLQSYVVDEVGTALAERVPEMERATIALAEQTAQIAAAKVAAEEVHALGEKTGEVTRQLASQIEEVDRRAVETTRQTAEQLSGKIVEAEKRVGEMTQAEIEQRLAKVLEKSREGTAILKARLKAVEDHSEGLGQKMQQGHEQLAKAHAQGIETCQARLKDEVSALRKANEELAARITALEQPKGFFSRLFGKRKNKGELEA
jgi:uncharacterized phage infection (PIP) family protein YhgE